MENNNVKPPEVEKIDEFTWQIKGDENSKPVKIFASEEIIGYMKRDRTLMQAKNAASMPSLVNSMLVMPDGHEGYGFPVGGVAAFDADNGIISPGAIGFDINCGVRLIKTDLTEEDIKPKIKPLMDTLFKNVPSGVGSVIRLGFTPQDLEKVAVEGARYIIDKGYGFKDDVDRIEENGSMEGADPDKVSALAKKRGLHELGTLGAGNHFLEVQKVEKVLDQRLADAFGIKEGQVVVMVHSGSRGYGHQVCSDYLRVLSDYQKSHNITLADPELSYAYIGSKEANDYLAAMKSAVNFAFVNRQIMTNSIRKSFEEVFGKSADALGMDLVYDVAHNIAKEEEHIVDGKRKKVYVHRKGATRAFGPGRIEIPKIYRDYGQPVIIPGSMGTASYILAGREEAMLESFGSSCHGSGRKMSRHEAIREIPESKTFNTMKDKHIEIRVRNRKLVSEESEWAYKDVDEVVKSIAGAKISNIVARMTPLGVAKG
ncbi:RtcB family protein [Candidatus Mancarchaeum acidiphilum]|uniref:RtcB family protein n=1 Tax=Candidatus Mancarchaeum acidiphilum TaxID=1920749 RepID=UPI000B58DCB6|nr:RtcB family protein [Candidatus Mancarchaeum acidiphilum]